MSETKAAIKAAMNAWGREFLSGEGVDVLEDAEITYTDSTRDSGYCETCSYVEYVVEVSDGVNTEVYWGSMGDLLREMNDLIND